MDYCRELERAIFNLDYEGNDASPQPVFNVICEGMDMEVIVPIETPKLMFNSFIDKGDIKIGDVIRTSEDIHIKMRKLVVDEDGHYYLPVFTGEEQMSRGEESSVISQPLRALFDAIMNWDNCLGVIINPWEKKLVLSKKLINLLRDYTPHSFISVVKGSVVDMHTDCIVNAANESLLGGGGVDGAIHKAAGSGLLEECRGLGGCKKGRAKLTGAYNIKNVDYIIHTVGPVYSGSSEDAQVLADCYKNAMDLALKNGCMSVAFPCISTGVYGYPVKEAARVALLTLSAWLEAHRDETMNIYLCCFREEEAEAYRELTGK